MYSTKYFKDEKFKDTIKKNSCRLRQKSSVQIGGFVIGQTKEPTQSQSKNENKDIIDVNKTIERNKTPKNKLLNYIKSKNNKINNQKDEDLEDKQIIVKKKASEECNTSIKQRILLKLKEQRFERQNKVVKIENKNDINRTITNNNIPKDIIVNRKKLVGSADIKNIVYRNRKEKRKISNTISKEENDENNIKNNIINSMNLNLNNYNNNSIERKGIYSLKNINSKKLNKFEDKNSNNIYINKTVLSKEKNNLFNGINNNNSNLEIINNEHNNNEIINNNYSLIKMNRNKINYLSNNNEYYNKCNNDISDNFNINKIINKNKDKDKYKDNNKDNPDTIYDNNYNKRFIRDKNDNKKRNNNDEDNSFKKNKNNKGNDDIIIVHKKETYFNKRFKYVKKTEEEKSKNYNDDIQKNNMLNKTSTKPEKKLTYYKDLISKRFTTCHTKKKIKEIQTSIKLSVNKTPMDFINNYEYNLTNTMVNQEENKKYNSHYLSTEKPKISSKSSFLKNLLINTGDEFNNKYKNDTENYKNSIFKNHLKYTRREMKEMNDYKNNKLNNDSDLSNRENRENRGISDLLKSEKKKQYFDKNIKVNNITNYNMHNYEYVMKMLNEAIQLKNSIEIQSLYSILLINFNNKYLTTFDDKEFPKEIPQFSNCYKYFAIMIIPLVFLHKDENIYKNSSSEAKNIFETFIYICIENIGQKNMSYKKIDSFIDEYKKNNNNKEKKSMEECTIELIKIIFKNYKEYTPLKKATEQLLTLIKNETIEKIIKIINDTILYCFNHKQKNSFYLLEQKITGNRNRSFCRVNQISKKDLNKTISTPSTPFIRCAMKKDFCLVLDIDETIVHSMNLPFGNYFLLRPGVINFLDELSKLYEIIIFTCSPKIYADGILNKIDIDNNYISHRLYKDHVIFEKGKSVKKLNMIGRDLNKIIFVDNMKSNAKYNLQNLCHVSTWIYDINDEEIINLKVKLKNIATNNKFKDDIRKGLENL